MYKERSLYLDLKKNLARKEYLIITGARQVGKTTLLLHLFDELKASGETVSYISLEDPDILLRANEHPENIFRFADRPAKRVHHRTSTADRTYLIIDEIQYLANPSNFLKYLFDSYGENLKVICSGSSAFYMDEKFKDSLAGRKRILHLTTLTFSEFLDFRDAGQLLEELKKIRSIPDYISPHHREILQYLDEYLIYGGYPAVVLERDNNEKILSLMELRNSFLRRDIAESGVRNQQHLYQLLVLLASQTGSLVNRNELSRTLGIDNKSVRDYINILARCFHIDLLRPYNGNIRSELTKMPKVYFRDHGMRNALLNRFWPMEQREDKGILIENYVFNRLAEVYTTENLMFWRTTAGHEIDFVILSQEGHGKAFEVKFDCNHVNKTSLVKFNALHPKIPVSVIAYNHREVCIPILKI